VSGSQVSFQTSDAQRSLAKLLAFADQRGLQLADLQVRRPSLEDVFLELTQ
jgi:hypothetical protein